MGPVGNVSFIGNVDGQRLSQIMGEYYSHFQVVSGANVTFSVPQREPSMGTWNNLIVSCISKDIDRNTLLICIKKVIKSTITKLAKQLENRMSGYYDFLRTVGVDVYKEGINA